MSDVQVIGLPQSNFVWAVRIALAEKGVDHENILVPPHSPDAVAVHPMGKIPVLRHGAVALGESRAIIDYIDAAFDGSSLVPVERDAALRSDTWTSIIATSIEPLLVRQYLFAYMLPGTVDGQPDRAVVEALLPKVEAALDVVETALKSGAVGADPFGRVDAYLVPILFYVRNLPEGGPMIAARPQLSAYLARSHGQASKRRCRLRCRADSNCAAQSRAPITAPQRASVNQNQNRSGIALVNAALAVVTRDRSPDFVRPRFSKGSHHDGQLMWVAGRRQAQAERFHVVSSGSKATLCLTLAMVRLFPVIGTANHV